MAVWLEAGEYKRTADLLAAILTAAFTGERVQFLLPAGTSNAMVLRLRVELSRSRKRNQKAGRKRNEFTLRHEVYPYTQDSRRHDCIVMWTEKTASHKMLELADDIMGNIL